MAALAIEAPAIGADALRWEGQHPSEALRLRSMDPAELVALADALRAARDGFQSVYNMPRCGGAASDMIDVEIDRIGALLEMAMQELRGRPLDGTHADEDRIRAIASYELQDCGAGILETLADLVRLQAEHDSAAFVLRQRKAS